MLFLTHSEVQNSASWAATIHIFMKDCTDWGISSAVSARHLVGLHVPLSGQTVPCVFCYRGHLNPRVRNCFTINTSWQIIQIMWDSFQFSVIFAFLVVHLGTSDLSTGGGQREADQWLAGDVCVTVTVSGLEGKGWPFNKTQVWVKLDWRPGYLGIITLQQF